MTPASVTITTKCYQLLFPIQARALVLSTTNDSENVSKRKLLDIAKELAIPLNLAKFSIIDSDYLF